MPMLDLTSRPLATAGLTSYRAKGRYGWIMIGATDDTDALREANRSSGEPLTLANLEKWVGDQYAPLTHSAA